MNTVIDIKPNSKRNQLFTLWLGAGLLFLSVLLNSLYFEQAKFVLLFLTFIAIVTLFIGVLKRNEPNISYSISKEKITYHHRCGELNLYWQNIERIATITSEVNIEAIQLPFVAIKLKDINKLVNNVSARLANRLIHEQKTLIALAVKNGYLSIEKAIINFDAYEYKDSNGQTKTIKGPIAAWLHRCEALHQAYGFHIFLPEDSIDRELAQFVVLLTDCQRHVLEKTI